MRELGAEGWYMGQYVRVEFRVEGRIRNYLVFYESRFARDMSHLLVLLSSATT